MQLDFIFDGGSSTRYHTASVQNRQSIADHSFGVAWFCELITQGKASKNLIMAALAHDLAEHMVGDIPSPAKRALNLSGQFQALEDRYLEGAGLMHYFDNLYGEDAVILKISDMLEGMMFCLKERRLGNRNVEVIYGRFSSYVAQLLKENTSLTCCHIIEELDYKINMQWKEVTNERQ